MKIKTEGKNMKSNNWWRRHETHKNRDWETYANLIWS